MSLKPFLSVGVALRPKILADTFSPPIFLAPSLQFTRQKSSHRVLRRRPKPPPIRHPDRVHNRGRGESAIRRTGLRHQFALAGSKQPLPVPNNWKPKIEVAENHGLWQFFQDKKTPVIDPTVMASHGRPWTAAELRGKSWEDLHSLWWVCAKEKNRIATSSNERKALGDGYGEYEEKERYNTVNKTQRAIKHVLTERYYSWQDATKIAANDREVDMSGEGPAYVPEAFEEDALEESPQEERRSSSASA